MHGLVDAVRQTGTTTTSRSRTQSLNTYCRVGAGKGAPEVVHLVGAARDGARAQVHALRHHHLVHHMRHAEAPVRLRARMQQISSRYISHFHMTHPLYLVQYSTSHRGHICDMTGTTRR